MNRLAGRKIDNQDPFGAVLHVMHIGNLSGDSQVIEWGYYGPDNPGEERVGLPDLVSHGCTVSPGRRASSGPLRPARCGCRTPRR